MRTFRATPSDSLLLCGVSHQTAPLELREQLSGLTGIWDSVVAAELPEIEEWALLSTCNRLELYATTTADSASIFPRIYSVIEDCAGLSEPGWLNHVYQQTGEEVAEHLCRVATGLESFVLGESQIQGQVTDTFMSAVQAHSVGPILTAVFRTAIHAGKRARTETAIGMNAASLSSVALRHAESIVGDLSSRSILVVGLGEMGQLALKSLRTRNAQHVSLANRTYQRAVDAIKDTTWKAYSLDSLVEAMAESDVVITATGSQFPVITKDMVQSAMERRGSRAGIQSYSTAQNGCYGSTERPNGQIPGHGGEGQDFFVVDLAVPRDVEPEVRELPSVCLVELDGLQADLDAALDARRRAVPDVVQIIDEELAVLTSTLCELALRPLVVDLRTKAETIRQNEVARTLRYLGDVDPETEAQLHHLTRALVNKLLHEPTVRIRQVAHEEDAEEYALTVRDLFGLSDGSQA